MKVADLSRHIESFREELEKHADLWRGSLDEMLPDYPIRNGDVLGEQVRKLSRKLGMLREYFDEFDLPFAAQLYGSEWDLYESAVGNDVAVRKGRSLERVFQNLQQMLGKLDGLNPNSEFGPTRPNDRAHVVTAEASSAHDGLLVFISHSSKDVELASAFIDLMKAALVLRADQIRCSSVDGYRLPVGVNTEDKLRGEVNAAKVVIGLITPSSMASPYVMFELGARWGAKRFIAPLLAGLRARDLQGPLSLLNALAANNDSQLHQLLEDVGRELGLVVQSPASYTSNLNAVRKRAEAISGAEAPKASVVVSEPTAKENLRLSVAVEGAPPSQILKLTANRLIQVTQIEYMLTSEATIATQDVLSEGNTIEVPIDDKLLVQLWNAPRHDRDHYNHSGPAKIGVAVSVDGRLHQFVLPILMRPLFQGNAYYRQITGSKVFYL
jgi:hypothetical protein